MSYYKAAAEWWNEESDIEVELEYMGLSLIVSKDLWDVVHIEWCPAPEDSAKEGAAFVAWLTAPTTDDETRASMYDAMCLDGKLTGRDFGDGLSAKEREYIIQCAIDEAQLDGLYKMED